MLSSNQVPSKIEQITNSRVSTQESLRLTNRLKPPHPSRPIVHGAVERGVLIPALTDYQWYAMNIYAVYPQTKHVPARVRAFIDFLVSHFGDNPYWERFLSEGNDN